jgi:hypothetical protein
MWNNVACSARGLVGSLPRDYAYASPGHVAGTSREGSGGRMGEAEREAVRDIPLGPLGEPGDIASLILTLVSGRASAVAGLGIAVDGGAGGGIAYQSLRSPILWARDGMNERFIPVLAVGPASPVRQSAAHQQR